MPASLRLPTKRSLGHLSAAVSPVTSRTPSTSATPAASVVSSVARWPSVDRDGVRIVETYRPAPGGENQVLPRRPRPDVWASAMNTLPSQSPPDEDAARD